MSTEPPGPTTCDRCQVRTAALLAHYPGIRPHPPRWCADCAGPALAELVHRGQVVTVTCAPAADREPVPGASWPAHLEVAGAPVVDEEVGVAGLTWTVERAVRMLRLARPAGAAFLRALIDEGGTATAARLREVLQVHRLSPMTQTLNSAMKKVFKQRLTYDDRHLARPGPPPDNPRSPTVHDYTLPPHLVPILDKALRDLGH